MQDAISLYADFVITIYQLHSTIINLFQNELNCKQDITTAQILDFFFITEFSDMSCMEKKQYHKKHFYYTLKVLQDKKYIIIEYNKKFIKKIQVTEKGQELKDKINKIFAKHTKQLHFNGMVIKELSHILTLIYRFERFWGGIAEQKKIALE